MREVVLDIETSPCPQGYWEDLVRRVPSLAQTPVEDTALDGAFGPIACIAMIAGPPGAPLAECQEMVWSGPDEVNILRQFWQALLPGDYLIGHNLLGFDLPYIMARSVICKVKPSRPFDLRMYSTAHVYDTQQVWTNWGRRKYPKLDTLAAVMGFSGKTGSGDQVAGWCAAQEWHRVGEYCLDDVRLTRAVYQRMREYGM